MRRKKELSIPKWLEPAFLAGVFFMYIIPCIGRYFYRDDFPAMTMASINNLNDLVRVLFRPLPGGIFFRPIGNILYSFDVAAWGGNAFFYFFHSVLWQIASIYLLYIFVKNITGSKLTAFVSQIIFLLYFPMNSGSVSLLSNRQSVMIVVFYLLSLIWFVAARRNENRGRSYLFSLGMFFLACFTRESAFTLPIALLLIDGIFFKINKKNLFEHLSYWAVLIFRLIVGMVAGVAAPTGTAVAYKSEFGLNIITNIIYYSFWLAVPMGVLFFFIYLLNKATLNEALPKIENKTFIFGLLFALLNLLLYTTFVSYRQLGWMHLSTIGMCVALAVPVSVFFEDLFRQWTKFGSTIIKGSIIMFVVLFVFSMLFVPEKIIRRNYSSMMTKNFIVELGNIDMSGVDIVIIVDDPQGKFKLSETLISPMVGHDVIGDALKLVYPNKVFPEIRMLDPVNTGFPRDRSVMLILYKDGVLTKTI